RGSWSALALNKTPVSILADQSNRCSVLLALDIHAYRPGASLVVEGAVGRAIYKHWLETMVLLRWEPLPGRSSIIMMDHCSTHAQIMYITKLGRQFGVYLLCRCSYSPHLDPIKQRVRQLKQWLR
ncbi:uncharacterized protein M437DRAFT_30695, partial [Aureobasidium melanogenum CBS 110374]